MNTTLGGESNYLVQGMREESMQAKQPKPSPAKNHNQLLGRRGEDLALAYLLERGYTLLGRNVRTTYGELDLVMRQADALVFVEVKARRNTAFGYPEDGVNRQKHAHLTTSALAYLQAHPEIDSSWRIDIVAVEIGAAEPTITHFENVFSE